MAVAGKGRWFVTAKPSAHQGARRELAAQVRRLIEQCLMTEVPKDVLEAAAMKVKSLVLELQKKQGIPFFEAIQNGDYASNRLPYADRNLAVGHANPIAPPMILEEEGEWVVGKVKLGRAYEGAPGFIHGGVVSLLFDQLFGSIIIREAIAGVTGELNVRYEKPTPVGVPLVFRTRLADIEGRHHRCEGVLVSGDEVLARASALMVAVDRDHLRGLFEAAHGASGEGE